MNKKWIAYGVTGVVGLGLVAGGAAATAAAMDLRTTSGTIVPGGAITGRDGGVLDRGAVNMRVTDSSVTVISAPSPTPLATASPSASRSSDSPASAASAPSPAAPAPAPAPADSPASAPSPASPASPASAGSAGSAGSD